MQSMVATGEPSWNTGPRALNALLPVGQFLRMARRCHGEGIGYAQSAAVAGPRQSRISLILNEKFMIL